MEVQNFRGDLLLRKYLHREYCENISLAKLNRFTVYSDDTFLFFYDEVNVSESLLWL